VKKIMILVVTLILVAAIFSGCGAKNDVIKIGHKNYTEQRITGQLLSVYIEETTDHKTQVTELGGTMLCYEALKNDQIDIYPEFTGTAYGAILNQEEIIGVEETYAYVKQTCEEQDGITWLSPLGWNNTYVLSVREDTMQENNLKSISDLVSLAPELILGCDNEFLGRTDGMKGLKEVYGIESFKEEKPMDQGLTYAALNDNQIDVNVSYSTDGRIAKFGLKNLEDDKSFFPPYYVTPILKLEFSKENPDITEALNQLGNQWTDIEMQQYNLMVDEGADPRQVATQMLKDKGLIE